MRYSRGTVGHMQLDEYVDIVPKIYGRHDESRSLWDVLCHVLHHAAAIAEAIRRESPPSKLFTEIADCAVWLFTLVYKLRGEFGKAKPPEKGAPESIIRINSGCSDLLWHRYPSLCPFCYVRRTGGDRKAETMPGCLEACDCQLHTLPALARETKTQAMAALRSFSEERTQSKPASIDEWQEMFGRVFKSSLDSLSLRDIALHFMEELGEVSDAIVRMYTYTEENFVNAEPCRRQLRLESQLADALSWLFALAEKLDFLRKGGVCSAGEPVRLSQMIWDRYGSDALGSFWCPFCGKTGCSCRLIFVPSRRSLEEFESLLQ